MEQVIYGDVLFVINFAMDFLSLYLTGTILHRRRNTWLLVLAASIGALYAVAVLFADGNEAVTALVSLAVSVLMCYTAYGGGRLIGTSAVFIGVSFMLGGSITALYGLANRSRHVLIGGEVGTLYSDIPPLWLLMLAGAASLLSIILGRIRSKRRQTAEVRVTVSGRSSSFEALCDSGNLLREPISGLPVVVASDAIMRELVPEVTYSFFSQHNIDSLYSSDPKFAKRIRMIPTSSITDSAQLLVGVKCDRLTVDGIEYEAVIAGGKLPGRQAIVPDILVNTKS